jgi:hypothetical protein
MRKLKLIRPWALSAVRQKLEAQTLVPGQYTLSAPAPLAMENVAAHYGLNDLRHTAWQQPCAAPCEHSKRRSAPERGPIFASTAAPHPGCPHLYS